MLPRNKSIFTFSSLLTVTLGMAMLPAFVAVRSAQAEPATPTVAQVMNDFIAASGGKTAYTKITSTEIHGTFSMKAQKITASVVTKAKAPDKILVTQEIAGLGKFEQGYDGKTAWARDPLHGLRTLEGNELEQMRTQARFNSPLYWKELYAKSEMLGIRTVNGAKAYAIRLTPAKGRPTTEYFDVKTKLLVRVDQTVDQPEGSIPTEAYLSDYRVVDGVKEPFTVRQVTPSIGEAEITTTKIQNNVAFDDAIFAKPAEGSTAAPKAAK